MTSSIDTWKVSRRLGVLGLIGILTCAVPTWLYVAKAGDEIATSRIEAEGPTPVNLLLRWMQATQQHRGLSAAMLGGNSALAAQRDAKQKEVEEALKAVRGGLARDAAKVVKALDAVERDWQSLAAAVSAKSLAVA
ncbi:MAG: methyl-accepting chemotaxis protein, partial [Burkholderiales bacterium]